LEKRAGKTKNNNPRDDAMRGPWLEGLSRRNARGRGDKCVHFTLSSRIQGKKNVEGWTTYFAEGRSRLPDDLAWARDARKKRPWGLFLKNK